jgi:putative ABC transport system ATP-binding protein
MLVELNSVSRVYRTADVDTHAVRDISLTIDRGEFVAIEGPSGCGKSTLLAILGILEAPTAGTYRLDGANVEQLSAAERARVRNRAIGFVFQNFNLIGDLTVAENVELPLTYRDLSLRERRRRVEEALDRVEIAHRANHYPAQLSGGQQQRVAVARAIAGEPAILLADEPTGNLDTHNGERVMDLLGELHRGGSTIVMVTHDPRFTRYADRTIALLDGAIVGTRASELHPA